MSNRGIKVEKTNKSTGRLIKNKKNLNLIVGGQNRKGKITSKRVNLENDICCGVGRKTVYFANKGGKTPTTIKKYPFTFNGVKITDKIKFSEEITKFFGVGYISFVISAGNAEVIGAPYKKNDSGVLADIPDYVEIY